VDSGENKEGFCRIQWGSGDVMLSTEGPMHTLKIVKPLERNEMKYFLFYTPILSLSESTTHLCEGLGN
jgi:hypothetical protein